MRKFVAFTTLVGSAAVVGALITTPRVTALASTTPTTGREVVNAPSLEGSAVLPARAEVTITNEDNHDSIHLTASRAFTIRTGLS
jgi:hypothetical protein